MHPELFTIPFVNITVPSFGGVVMIGFLLATWWAGRRCSKAKLDPDIALNLGFIILFVGTTSARAFYVIHYWQAEFAHQPWQVLNLRGGGLEIYGGLIGGFVGCATYILLKRYSLRLLADVVAPSLLLAMGIGRIGCFLFGCCWGVPCSENLPWAVHFPFSSPAYQQQWEDRLVTTPAELLLITPDGMSGPMPRQLLTLPEGQLDQRLAELKTQLDKTRAAGDAEKTAKAEKKYQQVIGAIRPLMNHLAAFDTSLAALRAEAEDPALRTVAVHPAQIYSAVGPILLAFITNAYFYRRKRHGTVILLGMALYAVERFIEEAVRLDNPLDTFGLTVSQAIGLGVLGLVAVCYLILLRLPLRSPRAKPILPKHKSKPATAEANPL